MTSTTRIYKTSQAEMEKWFVANHVSGNPDVWAEKSGSKFDKSAYGINAQVFKKQPDLVLAYPEAKYFRVVEIKYGSTAGSVHEKFETAAYKREYYSRMAESIGWNASHEYLLNENFGTLDCFKDLQTRVFPYITQTLGQQITYCPEDEL